MAKWIGVSRSHPCPVCQHTDWCGVSVQLNQIHCMRLKDNKLGHPDTSDEGYIYPLDASGTRTFTRTIVKKKEPLRNAAAMWSHWEAHTPDDQLIEHAESLGVEPLALRMVGGVWSTEYDAWAYPMRAGSGEMIGLRLRNVKGRKWAVTGSCEGLFFYPAMKIDRRLYVCEGPTDTAAGMTILLPIAGRPNCNGGTKELLALIQRLKVREVVIIADRDAPHHQFQCPAREVSAASCECQVYYPGIDGAKQLQERLSVPSVIWIPSHKDLRDYVRRGNGRIEDIEAIVKSRVWKTP